MTLLFLLLGAGALVFLWSGPQLEVGPYRARVTSPPATFFEKAQSKVRLRLGALNLAPAGWVVLEGKIFTVKDSKDLRLPALPANAMVRETEEVKAWIVDQERSEEMCRRLLERPGNRVESTLDHAMGNNQRSRSFHFLRGGNADPWHSLTNYGLELAVLSAIQGENVALTLDAVSGKMLQNTRLVSMPDPTVPWLNMISTNTSFSARLLLPPDKVLLVLGKPQGTQTTTYAFIVSPRIQQPEE